MSETVTATAVLFKRFILLATNIPATPIISRASQKMGLVKIIGPAPFSMLEVKGRSAGTLDSREPIKEPKPHRSGEIKNHLSNLHLDIAMSSFYHRFSLRG
jgi:hypothetical protein